MSRKVADPMSQAYTHLLRSYRKGSSVDATIADFIEQQDLMLVEFIEILAAATPVLMPLLHRNSSGIALADRINKALGPWLKERGSDE